MSANLTDRLRNQPPNYGGITQTLRYEAADEIDRLNAALRKIAHRYPCSTTDDMVRVAREALSDE